MGAGLGQMLGFIDENDGGPEGATAKAAPEKDLGSQGEKLARECPWPRVTKRVQFDRCPSAKCARTVIAMTLLETRNPPLQGDAEDEHPLASGVRPNGRQAQTGD
jgi:hypothetical protein